MFTGINHLTISVRSVDESFSFYIGTLGLTPVARWPKGAYLLAGPRWVQLFLDAGTRPGPLPEYTHIAFTFPQRDFPELSERIRASAAIWQDNWTKGDSPGRTTGPCYTVCLHPHRAPGLTYPGPVLE